MLHPEGYKTIQGSEDIVSATQTQYSSCRPIYLAPEPKFSALGITFAHTSDRFFADRLAQDSLKPESGLEVCFCAVRHAAGGMPNWVMNQRVKELAME